MTTDLKKQINQMQQEMESFKSDYAKLIRLFNRHVGNLGDLEHGMANDNIAGFMPPDLFKVGRQRARMRTWLNNPDVLTLECGYYTTLGMINGPVENPTHICDIDVYNGYDGRKNIRVIENVNNKMYHTTVTSDEHGNHYSWQAISTRKKIFSAQITDTHEEGATLSFDEKLDNYRFLEFQIYDKNLRKPFWFRTNRTYGGETKWNINDTETNLLNCSEIDVLIKNTGDIHTFTIQSNKTLEIRDFSITKTETNKLVVEAVYGLM